MLQIKPFLIVRGQCFSWPLSQGGPGGTDLQNGLSNDRAAHSTVVGNQAWLI